MKILYHKFYIYMVACPENILGEIDAKTDTTNNTCL